MKLKSEMLCDCFKHFPAVHVYRSGGRGRDVDIRVVGHAARSLVSQEAEAVDGVKDEEDEPEIEGDAGEESKENAFLAVRLLLAPAEDGREEGEEEDEEVDEEDGEQQIVVIPDDVADAARTVVEDGRLQRLHEQLLHLESWSAAAARDTEAPIE